MGRYRSQLFILIAVIIAILGFIFYPQDKSTPIEKGAVIILPVKSALMTHAGLWQQYANQESIIALLHQSNMHPILQVEDVINLLAQNTSYIEDTRPLKLSQLMTQSGAALVADTTLSKEDGSYHLNYHLYGPNLEQAGQVSAEDINSLYLDFAELINQKTGAAVSAKNITSTYFFDNQLLILALQQLQYSELDNAEVLLDELLVAEENNLIAQRQKAEIRLKKGDYSKADKLVNTGLIQANSINNRRESARLGLTLSKSYIEQGELTRALSTLSLSRTHAANSQDWLYLAYIAAWAGYVNQRLGRYDTASQQYQLSVDYHKMVGDQAGQVIGLNNLARLALIEYNYSAAYKYVKHSVDIVTQKQLTKLKEETMLLLSKVENKQQ
ncbi:hypothetical protein TUM4261_19900 [Shewanella sp. c952]|uniref:tetratricopeptide repeat protein n=1 Tax=Shewanella sp. c952 TaxID=2815913 RepID=UPI001BBF3D97|nr:hypothetical protein [Shewanella sp. c952]GIU10244.1 hypothetical protein TUM4261_19900 [Shewanella sp. c952]